MEFKFKEKITNYIEGLQGVYCFFEKICWSINILIFAVWKMPVRR